ncbi:MAG: hypothetical protein R3B09_30100 [Nannocystaceae bacterium]
MSGLVILLGVVAFFALVIVALNPERWSPPEDGLPLVPRAVPRTSLARRPSASFVGVVFVSLGAILMMVAERPELRARAGRSISALGQGGTVVGAAILGTRALASARRRSGRSGQGVHERPAEDEPDVDVDGPAPVTIVLRVAPESDAARVQALLTASVRHQQVIQHPPPEVRLGDPEEDGIECTVKVWIGDAAAREQVTSDLNFRIYRALRAAAIELVPTRRSDDVARS